MRKDAGLNGDLDRLPLLSWLLFLRAFDAKEAEREIIEGSGFRPALSPCLPVAGWAADEDLTGAALIKFVNERTAALPARSSRATSPATRATCSGRSSAASTTAWLSGTCSATWSIRCRRSTSPPATTSTRWRSLRIAPQGDARRGGRLGRVLHAAAGHPVHGRAELPRTWRVDPRPGLRDRRLPRRGVRGADTRQEPGIAQQRQLWRNMRGIEKKPLPYLLCMMNLILHGVPDPQIVHDERPGPHAQRDRPEQPGQRGAHQPALRRGGGELRRGALSRAATRPGRPRSSSSRQSSRSSSPTGGAPSSCPTGSCSTSEAGRSVRTC